MPMMTSQPMSYPCYEDRHHQCRKATCTCECHPEVVEVVEDVKPALAEHPVFDFSKHIEKITEAYRNAGRVAGRSLRLTRLDEQGNPISGSTHEMGGVVDFSVQPYGGSVIETHGDSVSEGWPLLTYRTEVQFMEPNPDLIGMLSGRMVKRNLDGVFINLGGNDSADSKPTRWEQFKRVLRWGAPVSGNREDKTDG